MSLSGPWTIAVADAANPANPSIAYVTSAYDRDDAIARVHAHHCRHFFWDASRVLIVAADPGTPPADAWYGWTDLRGIKALRIVLEPTQVRQLAQLRLRIRRWSNMIGSQHAAAGATGMQMPPSGWHDHASEAKGICQAIELMLLASRPDRRVSVPPVDPDVYLVAHDEGDALTCPSCHEPITWLEGGDLLGSLLAAVTDHRCAKTGDVAKPRISLTRWPKA